MEYDVVEIILRRHTKGITGQLTCANLKQILEVTIDNISGEKVTDVYEKAIRNLLEMMDHKLERLPYFE